MPKPICVKCHRFFKPKRNGLFITEGMPAGPDRAEPGLSQADHWKPYKIWMADLWQCEGCGTEIIHGFGHEPVSIQHMEGFNDLYVKLGANSFQVNDC